MDRVELEFSADLIRVAPGPRQIRSTFFALARSRGDRVPRPPSHALTIGQVSSLRGGVGTGGGDGSGHGDGLLPRLALIHDLGKSAPGFRAKAAPSFGRQAGRMVRCSRVARPRRNRHHTQKGPDGLGKACLPGLFLVPRTPSPASPKPGQRPRCARSVVSRAALAALATSGQRGSLGSMVVPFSRVPSHMRGQRASTRARPSVGVSAGRPFRRTGRRKSVWGVVSLMAGLAKRRSMGPASGQATSGRRLKRRWKSSRNWCLKLSLTSLAMRSRLSALLKSRSWALTPRKSQMVARRRWLSRTSVS